MPRRTAGAPRRPATPAACRSSRAPCPSSSRGLPGQAVALDLLIEVRAWHVQYACRLGDVPVELAELGEEESALRRVLEVLERLALEQRAEARLIGAAA